MIIGVVKTLKVLSLVNFLFIAGCVEPLCGNKLLGEIESPDKLHSVSVFERECGATTPTIYVVSLRKTDEQLDMEDFNDWVFTAHGHSSIEASWIDNKQLKIYYSTPDGYPTKKESFEGIEILYEKK